MVGACTVDEDATIRFTPPLVRTVCTLLGGAGTVGETACIWPLVTTKEVPVVELMPLRIWLTAAV
jgi:hypothetical protein